jgi:FtsK/SpoIIIE family
MLPLDPRDGRRHLPVPPRSRSSPYPAVHPRPAPGAGLLRLLVAYATELGMLATILVAWQVLSARFPRPAAGVLVLGAVAVLLVLPPSRAALWWLLYGSWLRRRWRIACCFSQLQTPTGHIPMIVRHRRVPLGERLRVRMPHGSQIPHAGPWTNLEDAAERFAVVLGAREVRVTRDPDNARWADVTVVRRDPLAHPLPEAWPNLHAAQLSLWEDIPVGIDEDGLLSRVRLIERNVLLAGEPGSGKSVAVSMLVATAALDPNAKLYLFDGALVELAPWRHRAECFVGDDPGEALGMLEELRGELAGRLRTLQDRDRRKVTADDLAELPLIVVVIDELAFYLNTGDKQRDMRLGEALRDLVGRGRKTGIIVLAATQKPSNEVIPTKIRDLFAFRWAFRCTTPQMSDTILGAGWATMGYTASSIDAAHRGVGLLLAEGNLPRRQRTFYLTDQHIRALATRARPLRPITVAPTPPPNPTIEPGEEVA